MAVDLSILLDKDAYRLGEEVSAGIFLVIDGYVLFKRLTARIYAVSYRLESSGEQSVPYEGCRGDWNLVFEEREELLRESKLEPGKYAWEITARLPTRPVPWEEKERGVDIFYNAEVYADIPWARDVRDEKKIVIAPGDGKRRRKTA